MTKAEVRKRFIEVRDLCRNPEEKQMGNEYRKVYRMLDDTGNLDVNYADNLKGRDGYEMAAKAETLTFKECCTVLTFLLRAERFSEGAFTGALSDGTVYRLLKRAAEVM